MRYTVPRRGLVMLVPFAALCALAACTSPDGEPGASCSPSGRSIIDEASAQVQRSVPSLTKPSPQDGCSGADGYYVRFYVSDQQAARTELTALGCAADGQGDGGAEEWRCGTGDRAWFMLFDDSPGVAELTLP